MNTCAQTEEFRFSEKADSALDTFYGPFKNGLASQKLELLERVLGPVQVYATGGDVDDELRLACLEYEWLSAKGLVELDIA